MTYAEAKKNGYTESDCRYFRGYVSRKINPETQTVKTAGGCRAGQLYVELPCWESSTYSYRQYLTKAN